MSAVTSDRTPSSPAERFSWLRKHLVALLCGLILAVVYLNLFAFKGYAEIGLQTFKGNGTWFKIYWADEGYGFSEARSERIRIRGGDYKLNLFVGDLAETKRLRIDPIEYEGRALIKFLHIDQTGFDPVRLDASDLAGMQPLNDIESMTPTAEGVDIVTNGMDGHLELQISPRSNGEFPWIHPLNALLIVALTLAFATSFSALIQGQRYVTLGLTIALVLSATMAILSSIHVHPDERVHLEAVKYYAKNNLPPALDSPEIIDSFSDYGKSRLSTYESYYPVAGWFSRLLAPLRFSELLNARLFGVVMLGLLLMITAANPSFRFFAMPLIVTPQLWYLYSYPNSDMFALALSLIAAWQFAWKDSLLNRLLTKESSIPLAAGLLAFGVFAGLLLLSKVNFYFFLLFLFLYLLWKQRHGGIEKPLRLWIRLAMIGVVAASMYGGRVVLDYAANGPDPGATFNEHIEKHAKEEFRPSTPLKEKHLYLYLREREKPLDVVLQTLQWGATTFATAFGSYGYTQYFGSPGYFSAMGALFLLLLGGIVFYALIRAPHHLFSLIAIAGACGALLIAASIWSSWNENFQAQGRYMMPILPMVSLVYFHLRDYVNPRFVGVVAIMMFFASVYSFVFIGLNHIGKSSLYLALS